jgi:hypothetical protein
MSTNENDIKAAAEEPVANRYTPDAQERIARLRAMAADFPQEKDPRPLTPAEIRLARSTSAVSLEKAAVLAEAVPGMPTTVPETAELRDAAAFEIAYGSVADEARAFARKIDMEIVRRKLKAAKVTRSIYRLGKGYVTLDAGDAVRPHVEEIKRTLVPRRRKSASAPDETAVKK